jgi:glycosyltransferase involved in cell wall biosynthesis
VDLLLAAIREISNTVASDIEIRGLIVGGGDWKKYQRQAQEMGLDNIITFTGPVESGNVPLMVASMDICTIPGSNNYGSPVKLFDYGAARRAVVAVNRPAVTEIIVDGKNGLLFQRDSLDEFVEKLMLLINDPQLRAQFGQSLFENVSEEHTWQEVARRTNEIFTSLMKKTC